MGRQIKLSYKHSNPSPGIPNLPVVVHAKGGFEKHLFGNP